MYWAIFLHWRFLAALYVVDTSSKDTKNHVHYFFNNSLLSMQDTWNLIINLHNGIGDYSLLSMQDTWNLIINLQNGIGD
jgi:hypothetical protein